MVAATKNKRGRPLSVIGKIVRTTAAMNDTTERATQNSLYAMQCIDLDRETLKPFFVDRYGKFTRQGIAEQIGRMHEEGLATDEELLQLTHDCIADYQQGTPVKEIERRLRAIRIEYKKGGN